MSLIKQLWLAVALLMLMAFGVSFVVSTLSAKAYLEEQLYLKNIDNASSLALSMNQLPKDPTLVELQLSAQFDTGHYQLIRLTSPTDEVLIERQALASKDKTPQWFKQLVNIKVAPGTASVMDGWTVYGTIQLESQVSYAYHTLWQSTIDLLLIFALAILLSGLIGSWILKLIIHPLDDVVEQAEAIGDRRFVTNKEPDTLEFKQLVRSMNLLSNRVKTMLEAETQRLESMRQKLQQDNLTGLLNRDSFMAHLKTALNQEDMSNQGYILLVRLSSLSFINQEIGHQQTDRLIRAIAHILQDFCRSHVGWKAARLNGSDFALLITEHQVDPHQLTAPLKSILSHPEYNSLYNIAHIAVGISYYQQGESIANVMTRADACLARSELDFQTVLDIEPQHTIACHHFGLSEWKHGLTEALKSSDQLRLARFNVRDSQDKLLHIECPVRLVVFGEEQNAGVIFPWISRLQWQDRIDIAVFMKAVSTLIHSPEPLCINVSIESLNSAHFRETVLKELTLLDASKCSQLWLDISERGVYQHLDAFRSFCLAIKPLGCKIGLEHAGEHFSRIAELNDLGIDYYKIDASFIRDIHHSNINQNFVQGVITVAHAIGMMAIAEGVCHELEKQTLIALGIDAMTGSYIE